MPKSSKKVGKTKSLNEQKEEKLLQLSKEAEMIKEPRLKIHSLARQSVKIFQDVISPIGIKEYDFKSHVVRKIDDNEYIYDEEASFKTFIDKAQEIIDVFPHKHNESVSSFIQKHQEYLPAEIKALMIATGSVDLTKCSPDHVRNAIEIQVELYTKIEFEFINQCSRAFPNIYDASKIIDCYFPRIKWQGSTNELAELMSALRKNHWIDAGDTSSSRQFSLRCNFHFTVVDGDGKNAKYDAIKKAFDKQNKRIFNAKEEDIRLIEHDLKFNPLKIGTFTPADK